VVGQLLAVSLEVSDNFIGIKAVDVVAELERL
jgi:hypothetical protein